MVYVGVDNACDARMGVLGCSGNAYVPVIGVGKLWLVRAGETLSETGEYGSCISKARTGDKDERPSAGRMGEVAGVLETGDCCFPSCENVRGDRETCGRGR